MSGQSFPSVMTRFLHYATDSQPVASTVSFTNVSLPDENNDTSSDSGRLCPSFLSLCVQIYFVFNHFQPFDGKSVTRRAIQSMPLFVNCAGS